jgi:molybdenum cofactor synthesis domain-containing protein
VTREEQIIAAEGFCTGKKLFEIKPYQLVRVGIVITGSEIFSGRIKDKFEPVAREKLSKFPCDILGVSICDDDPAMLSSAIEKYLKAEADLIILSGGMSVDPDDLTPAAIRQSGAILITQGIPMQPGNMLTMAYLDKTMLMGVPGASMHSSVTSLDVFLPRVFAGIEITKEEIAGYGEGGFCMGCKECRYPLCYFGRN